jgi:arylformamidase
MALLDVTRELGEGLVLYPGDPPLQRFCYRRLPDDPYEAALLSLGSHAGTHLDAPRHFSRRAARSTPCRSAGSVVRHASSICAHTARRSTRTPSSATTSTASSACCCARWRARAARGSRRARGAPDPDAARRLLALGRLRLVGIDAVSIEAAGDPAFTTHRLLLGADPPVLVLEGLDLEDVPPGDYELWCLPLRWRDAEAAPVRAVLRTLDDG